MSFHYAGQMFGAVGGGGEITTYATPAVRDAAGVHAEGAWCYVTSINAFQRFMLTRTVGGTPYDVHLWVPANVYSEGGSDPEAGATLQYLHNVTPDPVRWRPPNSTAGNDLVTGLPTRGWVDSSLLGGALSDVGGDTLFDSIGSFWHEASMTFAAITNMPSAATTPGRIFIIYSVDVLEAPTVVQKHRGWYAAVYDASYKYCHSNSFGGVLNNFQFTTFVSSQALRTPGLSDAMVHTSFQTMWTITRPGTRDLPAGTGSGDFIARVRDELYDGTNDAAGNLYSGATADATAAQIILMSGADSASPASAKLRSFDAFTMEE